MLTLYVWNAQTYEQVFIRNSIWDHTFEAVDFSPDSTRLISALCYGRVITWDIAGNGVLELCHDSEYSMRAAKYSPHGDRIATANDGSVRVWDSNNGCLLVDENAQVIPNYNKGLLWCNDHLLILSQDTIKKIDATTGLTVSEWPVANPNYEPCIALPKHGQFIACSANRIVRFWDASTHTQLRHIEHAQGICSIAISPDDRLLAIGGRDGIISMKRLSRITVGIMCRRIMGCITMLLFHPPSCIPLPRCAPRHQSFRSTMPRSIRGSTINSRTRRHY